MPLSIPRDTEKESFPGRLVVTPTDGSEIGKDSDVPQDSEVLVDTQEEHSQDGAHIIDAQSLDPPSLRLLVSSPRTWKDHQSSGGKIERRLPLPRKHGH